MEEVGQPFFCDNWQKRSAQSCSSKERFPYFSINLDIRTGGDTLSHKLLLDNINSVIDLSSKLIAPKVHQVIK